MRPGIDTSAPKTPVREIIREAAEIFRVPETGIIGLSRKQHIVRARQAVCRVAYDQGWSSPHIGQHLCQRDHSTVLHARDQVEIHASRDEVFAAKVELLERNVIKRMPLKRGEAA